MDTTQTPEIETVHLQEAGVQVTEDPARPADQVLAEQTTQPNQASLFVP